MLFSGIPFLFYFLYHNARNAVRGFAPAQYLFGSLKFNGIKDVAEDRITGLFWIQQAAESGYSEAQAFIKMRSEGCWSFASIGFI